MNLEKRQKVIIGLIVIALGILIWQLYALSRGGQLSSSSTSTQSSLFQPKEAGTPTQVLQHNNVSTVAMLNQSANSAAGII